MLVNATYHDHQEYIWFMVGDLNHFIDNVQIVEYGVWGVDDPRGTCLTC